MRNLIRLFTAGAAAVSLSFTWTVGQSGLKQTNRNLCDLWASLPLPRYDACEFQNALVYVWLGVAILGALWLLFEIWQSKFFTQHIKPQIKMIEPSHIIIACLAVALGAAIWQEYRGPQKRDHVPPSEEEITKATAPFRTQIDSLEKQLTAAHTTISEKSTTIDDLNKKVAATPSSPSLSKDIAVLIHRAWQLSNKLDEAKKLRTSLVQMEESIKTLFKTPSSPIPSVHSPQRQLPRELQFWPHKIYELNQISKVVSGKEVIAPYEPTIMELANKIAGDEDIQDNDVRTKFRHFALRSANVIRRADALIAEMDAEYAPLKRKIIDMKAEKYLEIK